MRINDGNPPDNKREKRQFDDRITFSLLLQGNPSKHKWFSIKESGKLILYLLNECNKVVFHKTSIDKVFLFSELNDRKKLLYIKYLII